MDIQGRAPLEERRTDHRGPSRSAESRGQVVPRPALLGLIGWHGTTWNPNEVVGETPTRYRIRALERTRLAGRDRWLEPGRTALVPKRAVRFLEQAEPGPAGGRGAELER
jgi:hypothetical protein